MEECKIVNLYNLEETIAKELLQKFEYPWEALSVIKEYIADLGEKLPKDEYEKRGENIWIHKTAKVFPSAYIGDNTIICEDAEVRHCAFIRGSAIVGKKCVVGNSSELKNCILLNHVQVPHYNYVGDSILGDYAHMGAGSILSNLKSGGKNVVIHGDKEYETGLRKIGSFLGEHADIGCGSVLNPGTIIGKNTQVYPLSMLRGCYPENSIVKTGNNIVEKRVD